MAQRIYLKGKSKQVIISTLKTVIASMEAPAQSLESDACSIRFAANPSPVCSFCGKRTTTALNHYECELRSYGADEPFYSSQEIDRHYFDIV